MTDESLIRETIDHYAEGMRTADSAILKTAFHELAILCGYLGDQTTVEFYERSVPGCGAQDVKRQSLDADIALRAKLWSGRRFRASVPPTRIADLVTSLEDWAADPMFGVVIGASGQRSAIEESARRAGGSVIFFDAAGHPENLRIDPNIAALLGNLKHAFDPDARLNPLPIESA